ncbi:SymE family type I addiction module toxin [Stenotrophomonas sp. AB1(2024)]|uniref:SymE family type I addiction module toxin n=1 Tax=Stenotrophomonas sp. AB1(2024) TaxID=3132215 RepID=UPI0030ABA159
MQTHWDDTSIDEMPTRRPAPRPQPARSATPAPCSPPPHFQEELKVPYLKLRGRWLRQMGFNVGRQLQIEACAGVITIKLLGPPAVEDPRVPRFVERTIYHGEVKSDTGSFTPEDVIR